VEVKQLPDGTATHSSAALAVDEFGLAAAVLPGSRSAIVGTSATGFTTEINNSKGAAYRGPPLSSQSIPERPLSVLSGPPQGYRECQVRVGFCLSVIVYISSDCRTGIG